MRFWFILPFSTPYSLKFPPTFKPRSKSLTLVYARSWCNINHLTQGFKCPIDPMFDARIGYLIPDNGDPTKATKGHHGCSLVARYLLFAIFLIPLRPSLQLSVSLHFITNCTGFPLSHKNQQKQGLQNLGVFLVDVLGLLYTAPAGKGLQGDEIINCFAYFQKSKQNNGSSTTRSRWSTTFVSSTTDILLPTLYRWKRQKG